LEVGSGVGIPFAFVDGEPMQRAVELAVSAAVEAMALGVARGGGDRGGAARPRELRVRGEAVSAGDLADQLRRSQRAAAALGEQPRRVAGDERGEL
jgi:hypothetical protein